MATPAIAFDIDGVFKAGRYFFPDGLKALADARAAGCAVSFVTNGGGGLGEEEYLLGFKKKILAASDEANEETKAELAKALDSIGTESMILSYTPMGEDPAFLDQRILLVGDPKEKIKAAAASYGWSRAVHVSDYVAKHPTVDPFGAARREGTSHTAVVNGSGPRPAGSAQGDLKTSSTLQSDDGGDCFDCVVVMTDPHDWFESLQVAVDVVVSSDPNSCEVMEFDVGRNHVQVHFSNPDIFWKAEHAQPRFGQGAFRLAFEALLRSRLNLLKAPPALIDMRLRECVVQWGKPSEPTLQCAERRLDAIRTREQAGAHGVVEKGKQGSSSSSSGSLGAGRGSNFWMVGDNPASDMALSALGGQRWRGCLVKTGVYVDTDARCGAQEAVEGVSDAVAFILQTHADDRAAAALVEAKRAFACAQTPNPIEACGNSKCGFAGCTCGALCACGGATAAATGGSGGGAAVAVVGVVCDPCKQAVAAKKAATAKEADLKSRAHCT